MFSSFQVDELISSTLLNVDCEEKVFTSVINWVKHDAKERKKHVSRVRELFCSELSCHLITSKSIRKILQDALALKKPTFDVG